MINDDLWWWHQWSTCFCQVILELESFGLPFSRTPEASWGFKFLGYDSVWSIAWWYMTWSDLLYIREFTWYDIHRFMNVRYMSSRMVFFSSSSVCSESLPARARSINAPSADKAWSSAKAWWKNPQNWWIDQLVLDVLYHQSVTCINIYISLCLSN